MHRRDTDGINPRPLTDLANSLVEFIVIGFEEDGINLKPGVKRKGWIERQFLARMRSKTLRWSQCN
jgi:hypothetical protein